MDFSILRDIILELRKVRKEYEELAKRHTEERKQFHKECKEREALRRKAELKRKQELEKEERKQMAKNAMSDQKKGTEKRSAASKPGQKPRKKQD